MSIEENKALARRMVEAWNRGDLAALDDLIAPDYVFHDPADPALPPGPRGAKAQVTAFRAAFPDLRLTVEDEIAEGAKVVQRLTATGTHRGPFAGVPATGKPVTMSSIEVLRVERGKIAEHWDEFDMAGLLRQLGVLPVSEAASS
jgi:steroid delta-isomerase-like uncharacterized protein